MMTISNKQETKNKNGFTLVELLASVVVLVAVGSVIAGILSSTLRGANKTNTVENIRQNGNYALAQMSKDIEYAQPLDGNTTGFNYVEANDPKYQTSCPSPIIDNITVRSSIDSDVVTEYICNGSILMANGASLIDETEKTTILLSDCKFVCTQTNSTDVPIIGISFSIGPKNVSVLPENNAQSLITFETSVTMRNYKK